MTYMHASTDIIRTLCERARAGKLSFLELESSWPRSADDDAFLTKIRDDIVGAIEHLPSNPRARWAEWCASGPPGILLVDMILLGYDRTPTDLIKCRKEVLGQEFTREDKIRSCIEDELGNR